MDNITGTWTKWDSVWAVRIDAAALAELDTDEIRAINVDVITKAGVVKTVEILTLAEWANDATAIYHTVANAELSRPAERRYVAEMRAVGVDVVVRNGLTYVL